MTDASRTGRTSILLGVVVALLCLLAVLFRAWAPFSREIGTSDDFSYQNIGISIAQGKGFSDPDPMLRPQTAWRAPLTPLVYAACYRISQPHATLLFRMIQWLLGGIILLLLVLIALKIHGDPKAALMAGAAFAVNPESISLANKVLSETLFIFFTLAAVYLLIRGQEQEKAYPYAPAGLLAGLAFLTRAAFALVYLFLLLFLLIRAVGRKGKPTWGTDWLKFSLFLIFSLLVLSPWVIRNSLVNRSLTLVTTNSGFNLYIDNVAKEDVWAEIKQKDQTDWSGLSEGQRDRIFFRRFMAYTLSHPFEFLEKIGHRLMLMAREFSNLLLLLLIGMILIQFRFFEKNIPLLLLLSALILTYSISMYNDRMGATMTPVLLIYTFYAAAEPIRWFRANKQAPDP